MAKLKTCPECNTSMEEGVTLDVESRRAQTWPRGPVEAKWLTGIKTRGKELLPVVSYRCPSAGTSRRMRRRSNPALLLANADDFGSGP